MNKNQQRRLKMDKHLIYDSPEVIAQTALSALLRDTSRDLGYMYTNVVEHITGLVDEPVDVGIELVNTFYDETQEPFLLDNVVQKMVNVVRDMSY